jgi:hypothetical protein
MPRLLNWDLLKTPENYVVVFFSCALALLLLHLIAPEEQQ